jgi:hypothetical protein
MNVVDLLGNNSRCCRIFPCAEKEGKRLMTCGKDYLLFHSRGDLNQLLSGPHMIVGTIVAKNFTI